MSWMVEGSYTRVCGWKNRLHRPDPEWDDEWNDEDEVDMEAEDAEE